MESNSVGAPYAGVEVQVVGADDDAPVGSGTTGTVRITPYIGGISQGDFDYSIAEAGQNFFSFSTDNGDLFTKIDFLALGTNDVVFADFRQNRIGPAPDSPTAVFEPASLPLFAMALGGLFFAARRRKLPMAQCGTDLLI